MIPESDDEREINAEPQDVGVFIVDVSNKFFVFFIGPMRFCLIEDVIRAEQGGRRQRDFRHGVVHGKLTQKGDEFVRAAAFIDEDGVRGVGEQVKAVAGLYTTQNLVVGQ